VLYLTEQSAPLFVAWALHEDNYVICIIAIHFALKLDLNDWPVLSKAWRVATGKHQSYKRRLYLGLEMNPSAAS
jgi:hypothetical protein